MPVKNASRILWISIILGFCFDLLFWKKPVGVSFFVYILLLTAAGFVINYLEGQKPAWQSWIMAAFTLTFSALTFIRQEPFTNFINVLLTFLCLVLLSLTFVSGLWPRYSLADALTGLARLTGSALAGGSSLLTASRKSEFSAGSDTSDAPRKTRISIWAVLRGLLLAFPIVFFMALLLVSADPVFSKELEKILDIERFVEYAVRLAIVGIIGYILSGIYLYSREKSNRSDLIGVEKAWLPAFLGFTESAIILTGVNLLFAFFVIVQFKYFFGGQANIVVDGYTYAEYARKGFGELVWVAIFSLILFLGLSSITRRETTTKQHWFSGLSLVLVCLVGVILVSSFMRLNLLEAAYGFTRLRTYSHVFMVWLGILLAAVLALELISYRRGFAMSAFFTLIGFGLTLNIMNVDGFIVNANVNRSVANMEEKLDYQYLQELSTDSVPAALQQFRFANSGDVKHLLGAALACRASALETQLKSWQWQGYHVSFNSAVEALRAAGPELSDYRVIKNEGASWRQDTVETPLGIMDCYKNYRSMD